MKKVVVDAVQMKAVDQYSIEEKGIPSILLMERAALAVCDVIEQRFKKGQSLLFVCSTGNNGADGLAAARILALRGWNVKAFVVGNRMRGTKEFEIQMKICEKIGIEMCSNMDSCEYDGIVDCIFGIGLSRNIGGEYENVIHRMNQSGKYIISVDVPSGINPSNGKVMGVAVRATETVTFGYIKIGLLLYPGAEYAGTVHVAEDVGFVTDEGNIRDYAFTCTTNGILEYLPKRNAYSNKGSYGHVLIIAGSKKMSGAAYFSAHAAYRIGTGLVKVLSDDANRDIIMKLLPECIWDCYNGITPEVMGNAVRWAKGIVIGPGLSMSHEAKILLEMFFAQREEMKTVVVDADALNIIAEEKRFEWLKGTIVTPHLGEMARLTGLPVSEIQENLVECGKKFAADNQCICVLKDARTIVTDGKQLYINSAGNNGMATAGSGDVLTGMIAGLLAQGMEPFEAAWMGVCIHAMAGDLAAEKCGQHAMTARDILDNIKNILKENH